MKKTNHKAAVARALKAAGQITCQLSDDSIIICGGGCFLLKLPPWAYDDLIRPVTQREPGDWTISGPRADAEPRRYDLAACLEKLSADPAAVELSRLPLCADSSRDGLLRVYQSRSGAFSAAYRAEYADAMPGRLFSSGPSAPGICRDSDGQIVGLVMPVRADPALLRAAAAWHADPAEPVQQAQPDREAQQLRARVAELEAQADALRAEIRQLQDAQTAAEPAQPAQPAAPSADAVVARLQQIPGLEIEVKGAQTAAPIVWAYGATDQQADALKAAGAKWSWKRAAWYVRVA